MIKQYRCIPPLFQALVKMDQNSFCLPPQAKCINVVYTLSKNKQSKKKQKKIFKKKNPKKIKKQNQKTPPKNQTNKTKKRKEKKNTLSKPPPPRTKQSKTKKCSHSNVVMYFQLQCKCK